MVCAFGEWRNARRLYDARKGHSPMSRYYLGMNGAFFVVMGGFALNPKSERAASNSLECKATLTRRVSCYASNGAGSAKNPSRKPR